MTERQKRRREWARLKAKAAGRAWQTGDSATLTKRERRADEIARQHGRVREVFTLPDVAAINRTASAGLASERHAARRSAVYQNVVSRDMPSPMMGTITLEY